MITATAPHPKRCIVTWADNDKYIKDQFVFTGQYVARTSLKELQELHPGSEIYRCKMIVDIDYLNKPEDEQLWEYHYMLVAEDKTTLKSIKVTETFVERQNNG